MTENKYPDYIELLKLKKEHSIYVIAALTLGIDPRYLKIAPGVIYINDQEVFTYEHVDRSPQRWYYPAKADNCLIDSYLNQEAKIHPLAPVDGSSSLGIYRGGLKDKLYQELKQLLIEAVKSSDVECVIPEIINKDRWLANALEGYLVTTESVKNWFHKNNLSTPFFDKPNKPDGMPNFLDKNHPEHSIELRIAIEAWQRFSGLNLSHPKAYVKKWLEEKYGEDNVKDKAQIILSKKAIERIITLINWNTSGGTTTEGFKQSIYDAALNKNI
jgi:hypothetical protein